MLHDFQVSQESVSDLFCRERQLSYDLTDKRNLRNKTEDHRGREGKTKQDETREGDKLQETLISGNKLRVAGGWRMGRDRVVGLWTLERAYAMVSAVTCVRLMNHRPVPLKPIIH